MAAEVARTESQVITSSNRHRKQRATGIYQGLRTLKARPNELLPPARPHLLKAPPPPRKASKCVDQASKYLEPMGDIHIQTTTGTMYEAPNFIPALHKLSVMLYIHNLSTQGMEASNQEFKTSLSNIVSFRPAWTL